MSWCIFFFIKQNIAPVFQSQGYQRFFQVWIFFSLDFIKKRLLTYHFLKVNHTWGKNVFNLDLTPWADTKTDKKLVEIKKKR